MTPVTYVVRDQAGEVGTADGYIYRWAEAGTPVAVLPQHAAVLLAIPGYQEASESPVDVTVPRPAIRETDLSTDTLVREDPAARDSAPVPAAEDPDRVPPPAVITDDLPDTLVRVETREQPAPAANVSDAWSDLDVVRLAQERGLVDLAALRQQLRP